MIILGLDTSSHLNAVGVIDDERVLADFVWEAWDSSLQRIVPAISFIMDSAHLRIEDVDGFAVGIGPGSWTGIRVGLTVGKMLAYTCSKPICGVSSLDALAYCGRNLSGHVCTIVDAGRGMIYAALYQAAGGKVIRNSAHYAGSIGELLNSIQEPTHFLGEAALLHQHTIVEKLGSKALFTSHVGDTQRGSILAFLAKMRLQIGEGDNALSLAPLYLRESSAQPLVSNATELVSKGDAGC